MHLYFILNVVQFLKLAAVLLPWDPMYSRELCPKKEPNTCRMNEYISVLSYAFLFIQYAAVEITCDGKPANVSGAWV